MMMKNNLSGIQLKVFSLKILKIIIKRKFDLSLKNNVAINLIVIHQNILIFVKFYYLAVIEN